ncbi:family 20 glycosylhydrolase [Ginsengibacter hankyongi]|uniref:beta-N-acetylhexosaminidase n=1 Tax=Ginsengibacter hankyongi TaxID=2607284 RepID=A0A5J5IK96_9BACT|nr:family 20 glycosylhydrolase [Ginsengibacter hankyongi]KAA9040978.1 family 20 glycosylhydrolase [Ginsengibacter hankyongi]
MKKVLALVCLCSFAIISFAQDNKNEIAIIPQPVKIIANTGYFTLPKNVIIEAPANVALKETISFLNDRLSIPTGMPVTVKNTMSPASTIKLLLNKKADAQIGKEGYHLLVTTNNITIQANEPAGLFYGVQTLVQLFPKEIESATKAENIKWEAPCVTITDYPRFGWRGLMFDVARHFFTKEDVEKYIDQMVRYKYNLLHLHLTDDEGWRIEIKSLPKLTEVGAWNVKKVGYFGTFAVPKPDEPRNYGGFYTQDDIKEIVQYAKERFVNILPEIDVPGHSLAAIAAYPELSCSGGVKNIGVSSGENIKDWSTHTALYDDNLCPANENVYTFLDKVITEVAQLFPFEYIHMGGDETFKTFWENSDAIKELMKREKLKNMQEVQSYFEKRVEKIVESKGKKFMGWDEILEGGLAPNAVVMSWRGMEGGVQAAKMGHDVVMSPTTFAYLDYMQGDPAIEPHIYATLRLKKAYEFEPVPDSVNPKFIKGGQANLWTEQVYNMRHAEYMMWPRGFAIAEDLWSPKENKNWDNFVTRVEKHFARYDEAQIKYAPSMYDPIINASESPDKKIIVKLSTEIKGLDIYYTFDNSFPDNFYPKYTEPVIVPEDAVQLKLITYRDGKPIGRMITVPVTELKEKAGTK